MAGAIVISNTDLTPAKIEGDDAEEGEDGDGGDGEAEEEEEAEEDEEALAKRLTANLRGLTLTHMAPNNGGTFSMALPETHVERGALSLGVALCLSASLALCLLIS